MGIFQGKTAIVTGASRGIGREFALMLAKEQANVVLAAKTKKPHEYLEGTIDSVAQEVNNAGGKALAFQVDVRDDERINELVSSTADHFGGVDIVINNAGAIYLNDTLSTTPKQFDLMHSINGRATFLLSRAAMPYLKKQGGHILNLSPPISCDAKWFAPHVAYTMSKFNMSMCTIGMADEFKEYGIAVNSLWPRTLIYTAAIVRLLGEGAKKNCRKPTIMADAARYILSQSPKEITGNLFVDEDVCKRAGINDLTQYNFDETENLLPDLYVKTD